MFRVHEGVALQTLQIGQCWRTWSVRVAQEATRIQGKISYLDSFWAFGMRFEDCSGYRGKFTCM